MLFSSSRSPSALVGLLVLALGPQPALSVFDFVNFSSVKQCGPFVIDYSGGSAPTSWPPTLTVVPFNSTPISFPLFDAVFNDSASTGHAVTFLPLPRGTRFMASLDDGNGQSAGPVSNVITIGASNATKCLEFENNSTTSPFSLATKVSQCESFTVDYDTAEVDTAPTIRAFIPGKLAFTVNQTADNDANGTAAYLMDAAHGTEVALLLQTDSKHRASSGLLTVGGNLESNGGCLTTATSSMGTTTNTSTSTSTTPSMSASANSWASKGATAALSQGAIIAIAASSSAVIITIVVAMGIWLYCSRRKSRARAAALEAGTSPYLSPPPDSKQAIEEKSSAALSEHPPPSHASWEIRMQTSWGSSRSQSSTNSNVAVTRNPLYTNPNLWLASPTLSNALAGSSKSSSTTSRLSAGRLSPAGPSAAMRFTEANAARQTPPAVSAASIRSHAPSRGHSQSSSPRGSKPQTPAGSLSPVSPAPTISTVDIEHVLEMSERFPTDGRDPAPPLPLRQSTYTPATRDSLRNSAYYAGQFPDLAGPRAAHSREGSGATSSKMSSVRGRVTPPNLRIGIERRVPSAASSLYSLHEGDEAMRPSPGPGRFLTSPTVHVSPSGEVIREPPHAHVPHSPMPSPFPSPL